MVLILGRAEWMHLMLSFVHSHEQVVPIRGASRIGASLTALVLAVAPSPTSGNVLVQRYPCRNDPRLLK